MTAFLCKVTKQRDNGPYKPNVVGQYVAWSGYSSDIREAQLFISMDEIRGRLPRFWEYEVIPLVLDVKASTLISKQ